MIAIKKYLNTFILSLMAAFILLTAATLPVSAGSGTIGESGQMTSVTAPAFLTYADEEGVIDLQGNITITGIQPVPVIVGKSLTINLNGHSITGNALGTFKNGGNLTINGEGSIIAPSGAVAIATNSGPTQGIQLLNSVSVQGTVDITSGFFITEQANITGNVVLNTDKEVRMSDTSIQYSNYVANKPFQQGALQVMSSNADVELRGGSITCNGIGVVVVGNSSRKAGGRLKLSGVSINAQKFGLSTHGSVVDRKNTQIDLTDNSSILSETSAGVYLPAGVMTVCDSTIKGKAGIINIGGTLTIEGNSHLSSDGTDKTQYGDSKISFPNIALVTCDAGTKAERNYGGEANTTIIKGHFENENNTGETSVAYLKPVSQEISAADEEQLRIKGGAFGSVPSGENIMISYTGGEAVLKVTGDNNSSGTFCVGQESTNEVLEKAGENAEISIEEAGEDADILVPEGIKVTNNSNVAVYINGEKVLQSQPVQSAAAIETIGVTVEIIPENKTVNIGQDIRVNLSLQTDHDYNLKGKVKLSVTQDSLPVPEIVIENQIDSKACYFTLSSERAFSNLSVVVDWSDVIVYSGESGKTPFRISPETTEITGITFRDPLSLEETVPQKPHEPVLTVKPTETLNYPILTVDYTGTSDNHTDSTDSEKEEHQEETEEIRRPAAFEWWIPKRSELETGEEKSAVYRLYNLVSGEYLYTRDDNEVSHLSALDDWRNEGIGWSTSESGMPIYRLYNPVLGTHLYTSDSNEIESLKRENWVMDNAGFPVFFSDGNLEVYRLYNPVSYQHLLTANKAEYGLLGNSGWIQEGIAFTAYSI